MADRSDSRSEPKNDSVDAAESIEAHLHILNAEHVDGILDAVEVAAELGQKMVNLSARTLA
jgi:hypothetical protein